MVHAVIVEKPKGDKANHDPVFWAVLLCLVFHLVRSLVTRQTIFGGMPRPASRDQNSGLFWLVILGDSFLILLILGILVNGRWFK